MINRSEKLPELSDIFESGIIIIRLCTAAKFRSVAKDERVD